MELAPHLKEMYISGGQGEPMYYRAEVLALEGLGLDGDRYAAGDGFWQNVAKAREVRRDVSLISAQAIDDSEFLAEETRRNLIIDGEVDLLSLIGREFSIGEIMFRGVEECTPCKRPTDLAGKEGFAKAFKGKGGIRAEVASWGRLKVGDPLTVHPEK